MDIINIVLAIYGVLLLAGAYFGYKAGSKISLISGLSSGVIVLLALGLSVQDPRAGYALAATVSALLLVTFSIRLAKTKKFMPSGMLVIASIVALAVSILQLI